MKTLKLTTFAAIIFLGLSVCIAQENKETKKAEAPKTVKGNGNAEAMRRNLNFPNAVNPATNNNQQYDKGTGRIENEHPKENLSNSYTRKKLEKKN